LSFPQEVVLLYIGHGFKIKNFDCLLKMGESTFVALNGFIKSFSNLAESLVLDEPYQDMNPGMTWIDITGNASRALAL
jgi:hypothetical protein